MTSFHLPDRAPKWDSLRVAQNGIGIHSRQSQSGGSLVLIHCVGLDAQMWVDLLTLLPADLDVHAVDIPGHGSSGKLPPGASLSSIAKMLAWALAEFNIGPSVICGISMGGLLAQYLALERADLVSGLLLGDTSFRRDDSDRRRLLERAAEVRLNGMSESVPQTIERWFSTEYRRSHPDVIEAVQRHLDGVDPESHAQTWEALATLDVESRLQNIVVPAAIVVGALDVSTPPAEARTLAELLMDSTFTEIAGAGHLSVLEHPETWADIAIQVLDRAVAHAAATQHDAQMRADIV